MCAAWMAATTAGGSGKIENQTSDILDSMLIRTLAAFSFLAMTPLIANAQFRPVSSEAAAFRWDDGRWRLVAQGNFNVPG